MRVSGADTMSAEIVQLDVTTRYRAGAVEVDSGRRIEAFQVEQRARRNEADSARAACPIELVLAGLGS